MDFSPQIVYLVGVRQHAHQLKKSKHPKKKKWAEFSK